MSLQYKKKEEWTGKLKESLHFYNPWWETERVPSDLLTEYQRPIVKDLLSYLPMNRIIVLKGPRRTGKTTIFYQVVDNLIRNGVPASDILFLSFDDIKMRVELDEILKVYQQMNKRLIKEGSPIYVLMDEVHFLENWQFSVKKYFDRRYPLKFLVCGSAASLIKKGAESLAGRTIEETIYPFSFYEFLSLHLKKQKLIDKVNRLRDEFKGFNFVNITELIPYVTEIKILFEEYSQKGGFPNLFGINEALLWKRLVREDIVEKAIYRDMVDLYDIKKPESLEKLFLYLVDISSQILSVANIANSLGLSREYTEKYLFYLEQSFLIKRLKKYARSVEKSVRGAEKLHILDAGLMNAFSKVETGHIMESITAGHLLRLRDAKVYYFRERYEVDFVVEMDKSFCPMEVKYKGNISKQDLKGIEGFLGKFKLEKAMIITRDLLKEEKLKKQTLIFMPAWLFMLLAV